MYFQENDSIRKVPLLVHYIATSFPVGATLSLGLHIVIDQ